MMKAIDVTIDPLPETENLISYLQMMTAPVVVKQLLLTPLLAAKEAYQNGRLIPGNIQLERFKITVNINQKDIPQQALNGDSGRNQRYQNCVR
jgi:hypothetical protein